MWEESKNPIILYLNDTMSNHRQDVLKAQKSLGDVLISHLIKYNDSRKAVLGIFLPSSPFYVLSIYHNM